MNTFAYLGGSIEGGTYRVFETLRDGLLEHGWQGHFVNETCLGDQIPQDESAILEALVNHLAQYDAVIANVFISVRLMNVIRFLPANTPRIMIVHNITHATYQAAKALRGHVHQTVAVSGRIFRDLTEKHGFSRQTTSTILNAVPDALFIRRESSDSALPIRILSLGRIENRSKNVFLLPKILSGLDHQNYRLTVAGDGPDAAELLRRFNAAGISCTALGSVARDALGAIYRNNDVFLFPSRFEGMPVALAEAMASGLVPIAAKISGITDSIILSGVNGYLFPQDDASCARRQLSHLMDRPELIDSLKAASQARARELFGTELMISGYRNCLDRAVESEPIEPVDLKKSAPPRQLGRGLRGLLPRGLRQWVADRTVYR